MEEENKYDNYDSDEDSDFDISGVRIEDEKDTHLFNSEYTKSDFDVINLCGKGAYAKVVKAKCLKDGKIKALKIMDKNFILKVKKNYLGR